MKHGKPNHLINEKSHYLLQHAYNPVDWYPWNDAAFEKAAAENKPIFLSIGYSSCHWCHVMEAESFEDEEVAAFMNEHFIAIKVDREERPDIDSIYMTVCQAITGAGGWPLTIVMTPGKKPFFAGTYFPKSANYGRPGLMDVLQEIENVWRNDYDKIVESSESITSALRELSTYQTGESPDAGDLDNAFDHFIKRFDGVWGGFNPAPKFPSPHNLMFLLKYWKRTGNPDALVMVERTLRMMHRGGIWDHIGGGFHRYSTDPVWLIPHFEKMLYDQAMLAMAYIEGYQATGDETFADAARGIFTYVLRDMTSPEGGFYSAEDADSEGKEGTFYAWTVGEIKSALDETAARIFISHYGLTDEGNFEDGRNVLFDANGLEKSAARIGIGVYELAASIDASRRKLFGIREKREHPFKDDKILTDWNGLMTAAFAKGAQVFGDEDYARAAINAVEFIYEKMFMADGRLLHRYRDGEAAVHAFSDDYAFLAWGLLELYEATFDAGYLRRAMELTDEVLRLFWDDESGGLFLTSTDSEELIARTKEIYDGAIPSGNSVAASNLLRLSRITSNPDYERRTRELLDAFGPTAAKSPTGFAQLLSAVDFAIGPSKEIVIAGSRGDDVTEAMMKTVYRQYIPNRIVILHPPGQPGAEIEKLAPFLKNQNQIDGKTAAYVCENYACKAPVTDVESLVAIL